MQQNIKLKEVAELVKDLGLEYEAAYQQSLEDGHGRELLLTAMAHKKPDFAKHLLDIGVLPEVNDEVAYTALLSALRSRQFNLATFIFEHGANPNTRDFFDQTPLHHAAYYNNLYYVTQLLEYGANIDAKDKDEYTPLTTAVKSSNDNIAKYLIEHGADVHCRSKQGDNILHLHLNAWSRNLKNFIFYEKTGVDCNVKNNNGETPLSLAIEFDEIDIVQYLLDEKKVNIRNVCASFTSLLDRVNSPAMFYLLWDSYTNFEPTPAERKSLAIFHKIIQTNLLDIVALFITKYSVDVNKSDSYGKTALFKARSPEMATLLLEYGADIDKKDTNGATAFLCTYNSDVATSLAKAGAYCNEQDNDGNTALHHYVKRLSYDDDTTIQKLLDIGIDASIKNNANQIAFDLIDDCIHHTFDDVRLLLQR